MTSRRSPIVSGGLKVLALLIIGIFAYYFWDWTLSIMDLKGTFHNTANMADLDNDGDMDVILQNVRNESEFTAFAVITLWFNQRNGNFTAKRLDDYHYEAGWASNAADVDNDEDTDLLVYQGYYVRIDLNQGGNPVEFKASQSIDAPKQEAQFGSMLLDDLNHDGLTDGIVLGCCSRIFTVDPEADTPNFSWKWLSASDSLGKLVPQKSTLSALDGLAVQAASLGDLDSDGDLDLFAAVIAPSLGRNTDPADRVLFNDGSGNFVDSGQRLGDTDSSSVALGDVDNDGDLDALVGNDNGALLWLNQGGAQNGQAGTFVLSEANILGKQTRAVFLTDLDSDGDQDALITGLKQAVIWWNDGQGKFTKSNQRFRFTNRHGLAIADFDNDGLPDIFAAEYTNDFRVWYNQGDGTFRSILFP